MLNITSKNLVKHKHYLAGKRYGLSLPKFVYRGIEDPGDNIMVV